MEISNSNKLLPLKEILKYQNEQIVYKFMEDYDLNFEKSHDIFNETKKWLWLCSYVIQTENTEHKIPLGIDDSILILDMMWHTFILFTKEYSSFCYNYLGVFVHHNPATKKDKDTFYQKFENNKKEVLLEERTSCEKQFSLIYDILGEKTLIKWYEEYSNYYSRKNIYYLRKKP